MIKIAITDDHLLVINGIKSMLAEISGTQLIFDALNGKDLLQKLSAHQPDILLLDIQLADENGINLCQIVLQQYPEIKVIALTSFDNITYVKQMVKNGASGYLLKNIDVLTLQRALHTVQYGEQYIDPHIQKNIIQESLWGTKASRYDIPLTKREKEILELISEGLSNKEIADQLCISLRTVETHRFNIVQKLDVKNTAALIKEATKRGLI